jgi:hypothetical protein
MKTAAGINCRGEILFLLTLRGVTESSHIRQRSLANTFAALHAAPGNQIPVDRLERMERSSKILITSKQSLDLLRLEANVGVDE